MTSRIEEVSARDLDGWDEAAVEAPGGHVYQSRAWGEFQQGLGWRVRWLRCDDGVPALVLQRRWPWIGGWSAYVSRGPIPAGSPADAAARQVALARWLAAHGVDVVAADPEIEAASPFPGLIRAAGFRPIEELQPSRHRMRIPLAGVDETAAFGRLAKATRQRIRRAEASDVTIEAVGPADGRATFHEFYDLLRSTGDRRGFSFGRREEFVPWWLAAHAAGHLVYLRVRAASRPGDATPETIAGLMLYRHGGRLSTVHSADRAATRADRPGVLHLLRWRALQIAIAEGCTEMDLGGVDVTGARRIPTAGEPTFGLYEHKRSFGAEWLELAGAHEYVGRPLRYAGGRIAQRLSRLAARIRR